MINPYDLEGRWTRDKLEEWVLFGICVANKPADATAVKVDALLRDIREGLGFSAYPPYTPFELIQTAVELNILRFALEKHRVGQYTRIQRAFEEVIVKVPDVLATTVTQLETVNGIGPKTARMIMLYYKPETACVPLDTHVLRWLREQGYDAPKGTPSGKRYLDLEATFVKEAQKRRMTVKALDTQIWQASALPQKKSGVTA